MVSRSGAAVLGLGLALFGLAGCGDRGVEKVLSASTAPRPVPITAATVGQREIERTVEVVGSLRAWESVVVGSKKEGRIAKVFHDLGDRIKPGEPLASLETTDADLAVVQAQRRYEADLAIVGLKALPNGEFNASTVPAVIKARVALDRTKNNLARERNLLTRKAGAVQELQNSENDVLAADATLADAMLAVTSTLATAHASKASLDVSIQSRKDMEIYAPCPSKRIEGGTAPETPTYAVSKRSVSEGQFVKVGDPVMELVIEQPLRLWTSVPERYTADVKLGQQVVVRVSAFPETPFEGKIVRINPTIDAASRTFQVETLVTNGQGRLRPGGFAKASIVIDKHSKATVVPIESIVTYAGVIKIFVVEGDKVRAVNVETGMEIAGWVELLGNSIPAGARVVTTGQSKLAEGTVIAIRDQEKLEVSPAKTGD